MRPEQEWILCMWARREMPWAANRAVSFHQKELVMGVCVLDPLRFMIAASKVTLEKGMATTPVFLPGEFRGQRGLVGSTGLQGIRQDYAPKRSTGSPSLSRFPCLPFPSHSHLPFCALKEPVTIRRITGAQFSSRTAILAHMPPPLWVWLPWHSTSYGV